MSAINRFARIQRRQGREDWRTVPNCDRIAIWEATTAAPTDAGQGVEKIHIFHIPFNDLIARGQRLSYLGQHFLIGEVSDSSKLVGLELRCRELDA